MTRALDELWPGRPPVRGDIEIREREIDTQARERERVLADARDHLLSLSKAFSREQATNQGS